MSDAAVNQVLGRPLISKASESLAKATGIQIQETMVSSDYFFRNGHTSGGGGMDLRYRTTTRALAYVQLMSVHMRMHIPGFHPFFTHVHMLGPSQQRITYSLSTLLGQLHGIMLLQPFGNTVL